MLIIAKNEMLYKPARFVELIRQGKPAVHMDFFVLFDLLTLPGARRQ